MARAHEWHGFVENGSHTTPCTGRRKAAVTTNARPPIAFLFPAFPVHHQTFVIWEVIALRRHGVPISLYSLKRPSAKLQQPVARQLMDEVHYLPPVWSPAVVLANLRVAVRSPRRWLAVYWRLIRAWWVDRRLDALCQDKSAPVLLENAFTLRQRFKAFFARSKVVYLLKSLWPVPTAIYFGSMLKSAGISHVHAHWASFPTTVALVVKWVFDIPFSFTAHAYDIYMAPRLLPAKLEDADFAVTCARVNAKYLVTMSGGSAQDKVFVNYHGVDLQHFSPRHAAPLNSPPLIVTCGALLLYKGHHVLLRACALLQGPWRCVVIGHGPLRQHFHGLAQSLGIADRVEFTGPLPHHEVAGWYRRADLFVLASIIGERTGRRDVIPNVLVEAMAMQVPVVSTQVSGIGELVTDGVSGRLVAPGDPQALAAVLEDLLNDPRERERLARNGYHKVVAEFDREKNIPALAQLLLAGRGDREGEAPVPAERRAVGD
jgi:colanic acid/amylovoran biosynthesis glycosyltransferase